MYKTFRTAGLAGSVLEAVFFLLPATSENLAAQSSPPKKEPDVLILNSGEKLVGELESSDPKDVKFKSQALGEVTVKWVKVKELHSSGAFVVVPKGQQLASEDEARSVLQSPIAVVDANIAVTGTPGSPPRKIPVAGPGYIVERDQFDDAFTSPGLFGNWSGTVSIGSSFVVAGQGSSTLPAGFVYSQTSAYSYKNGLRLSASFLNRVA